MPERQLDLFAATGSPPASRAEPNVGEPELVPADLDDDALIAAILAAGIGDAPDLAAEAGRRGLAAGVPPWSSSACALPGSASSARCRSRSLRFKPSR
jgi:hypothetical protein